MGIELVSVLVLLIGLVIGFWVRGRTTQKKESKLKKLELDLGPWKDKVKDLGMKTLTYDKVIIEFTKYNFFAGSLSVEKMAELIELTINNSHDFKTRGWTKVSPMRKLCLTTKKDDWERWRNDSFQILNNVDLYITASLLEEFIFQSINSSLNLEQKIKLSQTIRENVHKYTDNVKDVLSLIMVALDYDDLLYEYDWDLHGSYVNFDCIMWGCKKVMENIHRNIENDMSNMFKNVDRLPGKSKTRKCSSYKQRKRNKKEKSNE